MDFFVIVDGKQHPIFNICPLLCLCMRMCNLLSAPLLLPRFFLYLSLPPPTSTGTSLVAQTVKRLSTMQETRVCSLDGEDPLEKEMATHSSTFAWKIPWTEELGNSTLGESSREAQSGRRLLGTNGLSLWLWCCLPQPGALGP